jgi:RNA polymerase sigma factor (sigma-70 family)
MWDARQLVSDQQRIVGDPAMRVKDPVAVGSGGESPQAAAFRRLVEQQLARSYRLAAAILGDATNAEDAVHDAFEQAWRKWSSLRDIETFEAWFRRILVNLCRDRLRHRQRWPSLPIADDLPVNTPDPYDAVHDREQLARGLRRLRTDDQVLLALRYAEDLKVDDIARTLGIPSGTVMSRLHHATRRLREALDADTRGSSR